MKTHRRRPALTVRRPTRTILTLLSLLPALLVPAAARAATIAPVTTLDAENGSANDLGCSLRDAVQAANTNSSEPAHGCLGDTAGADTILLEGGKTYILEHRGIDDSNVVGDLDISGPLTIRSTGPGLATIDGDTKVFPGPPGADRVIQVLPTAGSVTLEGVRVQDGFHDNGGATGGGGGGILNEANLTLVDSEVIHNKTQGSGQVLGGGIDSRGGLSQLAVIDSTIADNEVSETAKGESLGGGIGSYEGSKTLTLVDSTVTGNRAGLAGTFEGAGIAGGVFAGDAGNHPLTELVNATVAGNVGADGGADGVQVEEGTMSGTIIAGNTDSLNPALEYDCAGALDSMGANIIGIKLGDCGATGPNDLVGTMAAPVDPNLGTLVDNGGPTRTEAPNLGSPAIDRGGSCPETDQRGFFRAVAAPCDSGAVELGASQTPPTTAKPPSANTPGGASTAAGSSTSKSGPPPAVFSVRGKLRVTGHMKGRLTLATGIAATCPAGGAPCSGTAVVKTLKGGHLGSRSFTVAAAATGSVSLKLTRSASEELRAGDRLKAVVAVSVTAPGTAPTTLTRHGKLKAASR